VPFSHPLFAQAAAPPPHQDCSWDGLRGTIAQIRGVARRAAPFEAGGARKPAAARKDEAAAAPDCAPPLTAILSRQVKGPMLARVGACVGQDGPLDAEWDLVNSGLLSLDTCLDCARAPAERTAGCKRARESIDRADQATRTKPAK
jgi:hypothetical protein